MTTSEITRIFQLTMTLLARANHRMPMRFTQQKMAINTTATAYPSGKVRTGFPPLPAAVCVSPPM